MSSDIGYALALPEACSLLQLLNVLEEEEVPKPTVKRGLGRAPNTTSRNKTNYSRRGCGSEEQYYESHEGPSTFPFQNRNTMSLPVS